MKMSSLIGRSNLKWAYKLNCFLLLERTRQNEIGIQKNMVFLVYQEEIVEDKLRRK